MPSLAMSIGSKTYIEDIHSDDMRYFEEKMDATDVLKFANKVCETLPEILDETIKEHIEKYGDHTTGLSVIIWSA